MIATHSPLISMEICKFLALYPWSCEDAIHNGVINALEELEIADTPSYMDVYSCLTGLEHAYIVGLKRDEEYDFLFALREPWAQMFSHSHECKCGGKTCSH